jgi:probable phosphoglycerate mutase
MDPPLHEIGQKQAIAVGSRLSSARIDAVYSSHLLRALHTAEAIASHHDLKVGVFEDLEEIRLGDWSHGEFRRRAATADPEYVEWAKTGTWDGIPNAEGDKNFRSRVSTRINSLAAQHDGGCIAVVCHGGVINAYIAEMLGTRRSLWMMVENTSITTVKLSATPSVLTLNDCTHLYDLLTQ